MQRGRHARAEVAQKRAEAGQEQPADATLVAQFIQAASKGDTAAVADFLGAHRVPVNSTANGGGGSALQYAAQNNHTETVRASVQTILFNCMFGMLISYSDGAVLGRVAAQVMG